MATRKQGTENAEPIGIVISNGDRDEPPPLFWAYEWSEVPESAPRSTKKRVA